MAPMTVAQLIDAVDGEADLYRLTAEMCAAKYQSEEAQSKCAMRVLGEYAARASTERATEIAAPAMLLVGFQLSRPILRVLAEAEAIANSRAA